MVSGPYAFRPDRRRRVVPADIPRTRLARGELFAEIIEDRRRPAVFLCVVQRQGSPEILFLGQSRSRSDAQTTAEEFMSDYRRGRRQDPGKPAA